MWTQFMDMHSGGSKKEKFSYCYIEAPEAEAKVIFYNRFGHNPDRVTCTCCGNDYSISEYQSLIEATAFERNCEYAYFKDGKEIPESEGWVRGKGMQPGVTAGYVERTRKGYENHIPLDDYLKRGDIKVIYAKDIKPSEKKGHLPEQGYVWVD